MEDFCQKTSSSALPLVNSMTEAKIPHKSSTLQKSSLPCTVIRVYLTTLNEMKTEITATTKAQGWRKTGKTEELK